MPDEICGEELRVVPDPDYAFMTVTHVCGRPPGHVEGNTHRLHKCRKPECEHTWMTKDH
jgi:hypothetical protein